MHLLRLSIHATPGARRTEAAGAHGQALRVRLAAPPVDGKANAALIAWAAAALGVPRAQVALAWVANKSPVTAPIIGASKASQLDDAIAALDLELTADEVALLSTVLKG